MKLFLKKILYLTLIIIIIIVSLLFLSYHSINNIKPNLLKIENNISFVFAGDSNVECAINDNMISNSINIAQSGEAYLFTFAKLRSFLEYNPQIQTIFLGFSFNNLLKNTEDLWLFEDTFVIEKIKNYNYLLSNSERQIIKDHNLIAFVKGILQSVSNNLSVFMRSYFSSDHNTKIRNFGGYKHISWDRLSKDIDRSSLTVRFSEMGQYQIDYIKMISELCRQKSVETHSIKYTKTQVLSDQS